MSLGSVEIKFPEETTFYVTYNDVNDWTCGYVTPSQELESAKQFLIYDVTDATVVNEANEIGIPVTLDEINGVPEDIGDE
jgi:hypothetical protein